MALYCLICALGQHSLVSVLLQHSLLQRCRQRKSLRVVSLGQRLRHFVDHITATAGEEHGERVWSWMEDKKSGWYAVLEDPKMPAMSTLLDQAHNAMDRKLFAMKGFHHPGGSQAAFLTGLAHLYNLIPYQRRAKNAGLCGVEAEGGRVPTTDWMLNLQILTSGGYRPAGMATTTSFGGICARSLGIPSGLPQRANRDM
jgi:hypothetical protein